MQGSHLAATIHNQDYRGRIKRLQMTLKRYNEEIESWQTGLELNDLVRVRSENALAVGRSLGIDADFWVEGIKESFAPDEPHATVLTLEEK